VETGKQNIMFSGSLQQLQQNEFPETFNTQYSHQKPSIACPGECILIKALIHEYG